MCVITLIESTLSPWPVITFVIPCFLVSFKFHTVRNKCPPGPTSPRPFCTRYILMDTFSTNTSGINSRDAVGVSDCHRPPPQEDNCVCNAGQQCSNSKSEHEQNALRLPFALHSCRSAGFSISKQMSGQCKEFLSAVTY